MTTPKRILVIHNPAAGRRRKGHLEAVVSRLQADGITVVVRATQMAGHGETLARESASESFDIIVAAGGDGTINEVLNGLAGRPTPLGVLPVGTANVLTAELGFPDTVDGLAAMLRRGRTLRIYPGVVAGRRFATVAGIGLDALIVDNVHLGLKRWFGKGAYVWQYFVEMLRYRPRVYRFDIDGNVYRAAGAIISNARYYAGRFVCTPDARLTVPCFHACVLGTPSRSAIFRYGLALLAGRLYRLADVTVVPGTRLRVADENGAPVQADGDIVARLPVEIATVTEGVEIVVP